MLSQIKVKYMNKELTWADIRDGRRLTVHSVCMKLSVYMMRHLTEPPVSMDKKKKEKRVK